MPLIAVLAGAVLGYTGGPAQVLIVWAIIGLVLGYFSATRRTVIASGLLFGFIVSFMFMVAGYAGEAPVYTHFLPFAALGVFGAVCGIILSISGHYFHMLFFKYRRPHS